MWTRHGLDNPEIEGSVPGRDKTIYHSPKRPQRILDPQKVTKMLSPGSKRWNCEADDSQPSKAEVKHEWSSTLLLLYALTTAQGQLHHFVPNDTGANLRIVTLVHATAVQQVNTGTCFDTCIERSIRNRITEVTNIFTLNQCALRVCIPLCYCTYFRRIP